MLEVNTPAAVTGQWSTVATRARSGAPDGLIPDAIPAASNPAAAVTLTRSPSRWHWSRHEPDRAEPRRLEQAEHEVGALHRLPGCALHEIVERAHGEHGVGARVVAHAHVRGIRSHGRLRHRRLVGDDHERLVGV